MGMSRRNKGKKGKRKSQEEDRGQRKEGLRKRQRGRKRKRWTLEIPEFFFYFFLDIRVLNYVILLCPRSNDRGTYSFFKST